MHLHELDYLGDVLKAIVGSFKIELIRFISIF
jgi:hypothetical protein